MATVARTMMGAVVLLVVCCATVRANPPNPDLLDWRGPCFNCYNYAIDRKDAFFAQPPIAGPLTCSNTTCAAVDNGLAVATWPGPAAGPAPAGWPANACPIGDCLVALVVDPGTDFHWYRYNATGVWSHKQGQTPATDLDAAGNPMGVANPPHVAALGAYNFCSYMCVPQPPAPLPGVISDTPWAPVEILRAWVNRGTGVMDLFHDFADVIATLSHLPSGIPVPDPGWSNNEAFRGYSLASRSDAQPMFPPYLRVFDGVVAYFSDLAGTSGTTVSYFLDDFGLEAFLAAQFGCELPSCNDDNPCTDDSCTSVGGAFVCQHTPNTLECNDGNRCTVDDTCTGGACVGTPDLGTCHYQCYEVRRKAFAGPTVTLDDAFGSAQTVVELPEQLCAPADKNDEDPDAPGEPDHLAGYRVRHPFSPRLQQRFVNQFGASVLDIVRPDRLQVPTAKSLTGPTPALVWPKTNHFQCYRIRQSRGTPRFVPVPGVEVEDQFGTATVTVKRPVRLCAPVDKSGENPGVEDDPVHLLCYRTSFAPFPTLTPFVNNQFGPQSFILLRRTELCVPSLLAAAAPAVACGACVALNAADQGTRSCDAFDDGQANASCLLPDEIRDALTDVLAAQAPGCVSAAQLEFVPAAPSGFRVPRATNGRDFEIDQGFDEEFDLSDVATKAGTAGYTVGEARGFAKKTTVLDNLKDLNGNDVWFYIGHGVVDDDGEAVGIEARDGDTRQQVSLAEMITAIQADGNAPGLMIMGGCGLGGLTESLVAACSKVAVGWDRPVRSAPQVAGIKAFWARLVAGDTIMAAVAAAEAAYVAEQTSQKTKIEGLKTLATAQLNALKAEANPSQETQDQIATLEGVIPTINTQLAEVVADLETPPQLQINTKPNIDPDTAKLTDVIPAS